MKKILIYYSHRQTLGHQSRVSNIAASIFSNYPKKARVFLFNAGMPEECIQFPRGTVCYNIPSPFHSKHDFKIGKDFIRGDVADRTKFMLEHIKKIKPDVFVTEYFPFGRPDLIEELSPVLRILRANGVKILSSLGYPYVDPFFFIPGKYKTFDLLAEFYENILIHTPDEFENRFAVRSLEQAEQDFQKIGLKDLKNSFSDVMSAVKDKILYTGYVVPEEIRNVSRPAFLNKIALKDKTFVLVSRGGGVIYPKILTSAILAKKILGDKFIFLIVPGPSSSSAELALFRSLIQKVNEKGLHMRSYIPKMFRYVRFCDISVSMCGYNTSVELLYFRKKSIVVPWQLWKNKNTSYYNDQVSRSYLLKEYLDSKIIPITSISADMIAEGIKEQLAKDLPRPVLKRSDFDGAYVTAERIMRP